MLENSLRGEKRANAGMAPRNQAQIVAFLGARGGVGTTTVAGSVAWALAHVYQKRVALLDFDLHLGNLALSFDLVPAPGLREALEYPARIDSRLLSMAMVQESPRLKVLAGEEPLVDDIHVAPGAVDAMLNVLRGDNDFILVDLPRHLDETTRRLLTLCGTIGIVTDLSLASARDTLRLSDFAKTMTPAARHLNIANNVGAKHRGEIAQAEFERVTAIHLDYAIPFEPAAALTTSSTGNVLTSAMRHTKAAGVLRDIAMRLAGYEQKAAKKSMLSSLTSLPKLSGGLNPAALLPSFLKRSA
jgi:pilus assembly protein CpaE